MSALRRFRFGDYVQEVTIRHQEISYNLLMPKPRKDAKGKDLPFTPPKLKLKPLDVQRLLAPYVSSRFLEQFRAVVPLAIYLGAFQFLVLRQTINDAATIAGGLLAVMLGLMLFMEGLKLGLMPYSEAIGTNLPKKTTIRTVMGVAFALGIGVTFAEPAIGALQDAGRAVDVVKAPYLYTLLTDRSSMLVFIIALSSGCAALLGVMRFVWGWRLKPMVLATLLPMIGLTAAAHFHPELKKIIGLAWDTAGAVSGPVTVPLVLALGIGVATSIGRGTTPLSGFGIVTMGSLLPVSAVLLYATYVVMTVSPQQIVEAAHMAARSAASVDVSWTERSPGQEIVASARAILPLVIFLALVMRFVIGEKIRNFGIIRYGIVLTLLGMVLFNVGLSYGLNKLGDQSGSIIPAAFTRHEQVENSPLFGFTGGIFVIGMFAWMLGFGATLAEPAVNALASTVEDLTSGAFRASMLKLSLAFGVSAGITVGVLKVIFAFPLEYILVPAYLIAALLTLFSSEEMVNLGWDAAAVTSGPVTTPLVLAMGLGIGNAVGAIEGFGIVAVASVFSVFPVLLIGLMVERRQRMQGSLSANG